MSGNGRRRRSDGERSRAAILEAATKLATTEGLEGLSIGRLADEIGMSKSGLYAHFGSKEELQLATVETAGRVFAQEVIVPAREQSREGLARIEALCERFLSYLERQVFPGGCFFDAAAAEFDTHPGPVKERVAEFLRGWNEAFRKHLAIAQAAGEISPDEDAAQLAFELHALLQAGNSGLLLTGEQLALERARRGIEARLRVAAAQPAAATR